MNRLYLSHVKIISVKLAKKISIAVFSIFIFDTLFFSLPLLANEEFVPQTSNVKEVYTISNHLPSNNDIEIKVKYAKYTTITAYNSEVAQTNDQPCITANGFDVCKHGIEDTIAANFLRFGTKVRIPELFGDRIFIVRDRMNERYPDRVDVWLLEKKDAINLGKRLAKIEILE